jgi:spore maturation protein CgeB
MISVIREEQTDYLYPGFLDNTLASIPSEIDVTISIEPKRGEYYFSQDYFISKKDYPFKYVFYTLPSLKELFENELGENCAMVSYAADEKFHTPKKTRKLYDVGFIGRRYYYEREKYLDTITKFYPRSFLNLDTCPNKAIQERLSECKVLFNHTRPEIDVNLRFFEEMALGCQVMMRTPSLKEFAQEGKHYMGYSSEGEALEVIKKLLKDNNLREKITYNARRHFLKHHTYTHRAKTIVKHLEQYFKRTDI